MLPSRSKRFVSTEHGDLPRLRLAENWQLGLIALIMLSLFVVIFPRQALVKSLYGQKELDELTLFYIDNLHRTDPQNPDLAILLARARQEKLEAAAMESLLKPVFENATGPQRHEARQLLLQRYAQALSTGANRDRIMIRARMASLLEQQLKEAVSPEETRQLALLAFRLGQTTLGVGLLQRAAKEGGLAKGETLSGILSAQARIALGTGQYDLSAQLFLLARHHATQIDEARNYFQEGIGAWMAASRFAEAMQAADAGLGNLATDAPTLRYLVRTAMAAGDPARAAAYARKLMFGQVNGSDA